MGFRGFFLRAIVLLLIIKTNVYADSHSLSGSDKLFKEATDLVKAKQYNQAISIFEKLANASEHDAQYNLAILLKAGKGKTKKYTDALYWAFLAKLGEIPEADDLVGDLIDLLPEKTVETVRQEVRTYLEDSVENGSEASIMHLGRFFLDIISEKEYASAYKWFTIGSALGIKMATKVRDEVEKELSPEEIVEEQEKAEVFFQKFIDQYSNPSDKENSS